MLFNALLSKRLGLLFFGLFILSNMSLNAQYLASNGSSTIYQQLQKLNVLGSVLYIAAHPDDENNSLLPYLAKEKKYRTAYLSLTRGDGGQNLIGPEQGIDLGLIRTQELLAARQIDGSEQYFTRAYEFGFSKTSNETLSFWDRKKVLGDMVWVIRKFQPDIIVNRFPPDARAGHGHHAASAILSMEAFKAAADPLQFPEQLSKGVTVWQAKRLLWNTFNFGGANTTSDSQLKIDAGIFNPFLGQSYGEVGGEARSMHKSQGEGRPRRKGPVNEFFVTIAGDSAKTNLMDGIITDWSRLHPAGKSIEAKIQAIIRSFNFEQPALSVHQLTELYQQVNALTITGVWKEQKLKEISQLIVDCAGLVIEATTDLPYAIPGEKLGVQFLVNKRSDLPISLTAIQLNDPANRRFDTSISYALRNNVNFTASHMLQIPFDQTLSQPYWLAAPMKDMGTFQIADDALIGNANSPAALSAQFTLTIHNLTLTITKPVQYKYVDLVAGEMHQPLTVIPRLMVSLDKAVLLSQVKTSSLLPPSVTLQIKSNVTTEAMPMTIVLKQGNQRIYSKDTIMALTVGNAYPMTIQLENYLKRNRQEPLSAEVQIKWNGTNHTYDQMLKTIQYNHIPSINYLYKDQATIIHEPIQSLPKRIGYIVGAGDKVPEALIQLGHTVEFLQESDIVSSKLAAFDAIIVGIRAYNIHEWLTNKNDIINRYIENGGHLIVQYLKGNTVGNKRVKVGPYDFSMSNTRVTEENAPVQFLLPTHPILNYPNKISQKDFDDWVQERSTYQMEPVKAPYEALLQMNDANDKPTTGSLITAPYGKGHFTYISLVLFRQLPAGVAGSYKLLANILSLSAKP
jgi:LmbE family N-acetylglucosaminyl deacetylase